MVGPQFLISGVGRAAIKKIRTHRRESGVLKKGETLTHVDWAIFGLALLLLAPPVLVIVFLNKSSVSAFVISEAGRSHFLSYCSFWLAAMAGLTAGRGVVRHQRGTPKAELAVASIQDYIESAVLLVSSACALALTALDEPLPHRAFLMLLTSYPIIYGGYLFTLKIWEKQRRKRNKAFSLASIGLRHSRRSFLIAACIGVAGLWIMDQLYLPSLIT